MFSCANKQYYIPGDAIVHGTFNNQKMDKMVTISEYLGMGLSRVSECHPDCDNPPAKEKDHWKYKPIDIRSAQNTAVEGITIVDSAMHSLMLISAYKPEQ